MCRCFKRQCCLCNSEFYLNDTSRSCNIARTQLNLVVVSLSVGRLRTPLVGWETLCCDVRPLILGKLNLRDLARAAGTCREFHGACHNRAAEDRAALIAAREEADGKLFFHKFVTAFRRAMVGFSPSPGVLSNSTESKAPTTRIPPVHRFANIDAKAWVKWGASGKSFAIIPWLSDHVDEKVFNARLYGTNGNSITYWTMPRSGGEYLSLQIVGHSKHAGTAMALLAAACLQDLEGAATSSRSPLTVRCRLNVCAVGDLSQRELGDLVAPLRYRAGSVTITAHNVDVAPVLTRGGPQDWLFRGFIVDIKQL